MLARSALLEVCSVEGEVGGLAPAVCCEERMGDKTDWDIVGEVRGAKGLFTEEVDFSEPRPGGLVGDSRFVSTLERTGRCLRLAAAADVGAFGFGNLSGTV
jgi:hypothetical protein